MAAFDFIKATTFQNFAASTSDASFSGNVTAGSTLAALIGGDGGVTVTSVATQSGTATTSAWSRADTPSDGAAQHVEIWTARVLTTGTLTVRGTMGSAVGNGRFTVAEYEDGGAITVGTCAKTRTGGGSTTHNTGNVSSFTGLLVGVFTPTGTAVTATGNSGLTIRSRSGLDDCNLADKKVTASVASAEWGSSPGDSCNIMAAPITGDGVLIGGGGAVLRKNSLLRMGVGR